MKKTLLCVLFCLMGCFFLSACGPVGIPDPYGIMEPTSALYEGLNLLKPGDAQAQTGTAAEGRYSVIIDDGFGMKGFVHQSCMSYRAAISAVSSVSMSKDFTSSRASEFLSGSVVTDNASEKLFQNAVQDHFFREKSNDIASVIARMAGQVANQPDQVMILVSDLMIQTEDDCIKAANALVDAVIKPEHATMGIIGIVGEFRGTIENLPVNPKNGQNRQVRDYMVLERDENGNFRHPLYVLFLGNDQMVLAAMQKALTALESCGLLDESTPHYALYFSEYDVSRREKDDIFSTFNLGCQEYNLANYPAENMVRGLENASGKIRYPAASEVPEAYQQLLNDLPIAKIYNLERGNTEKNVKIRCTVPFTLTDSLQSGAIVDQHKLVLSAEKLKLALEDYAVLADIQVLEYSAQSGGKPQAAWVTPDAALISVESAKIDESRKKIEVVLNVDTSLLAKDAPLFCTVGVRVSATPQWEEVTALYDTNWVKELTLNLKDFSKEAIIYGEVESSARFTYATTAKTPFLSNLICGIAEQQMESVMQNIATKTEACVQTTMFGFVVRDVPNRYVVNGTWDESQDFHGWAFSVEDALKIQAAMDE